MSGLVLILDGTPEGPELASELRSAGHLVMHARPEDGAALAAHRRPSLVVLDADAPGALALCGVLRSGPECQNLPIVLAGESGLTLQSTADAIVRGGDAFFPRPVDRARLLLKIGTLLGTSAAAPAPTTGMPAAALAPGVVPRERTFVLGDEGGDAGPPREPTFVLPPPIAGTPSATPTPAPETRPSTSSPSVAPATTTPSTPAHTPAGPGPAPRPPVSLAPPPSATRPSTPAPARTPSSPPHPAEPDMPLSTELRRVLSDVEQRLFPDAPPLSFQGLPSEEDLEAFLPPELAEELGRGLEGGEDDASVDTFAGAFETESFRIGVEDDVSVVVPKGAYAVPATPEQTGVVPSVSDAPPRPARTEQVPAPPSPPTAPEPPRPTPLPASTTRQPRPPTGVEVAAMGEMPTGLAPFAPEPPVVRASRPPTTPPERPPTDPSRATTDDAASTSPGDEPGVGPVLRLFGRSAQAGELHETDLPQLLAAGYAGRLGGRLRLRRGDAEKVVHFVEGQVVLVTSNLVEDRLVEVLWREGRIARDQFEQVRAMIAGSGRRAGAILVERGVLRHEELFPLVRHHFEGLLFGVFAWETGQWSVEAGAPPAGEQILIDQPTPALVVEGVRRKFTAEMLGKRLGGPSTVLRARAAGICPLEATGLLPEEQQALALCDGVRPLGQIARPGAEIDLGAALYALLVLGLVEVAARGPDEPAGAWGPSEIDALRHADIDRTRLLERLRQARTGDYFAVLGLTRGATGYEVRRAYLDLRRELHAEREGPLPEDLSPAVAELTEMVDEAYEILRDPELRSSYLAHLP